MYMHVTNYPWIFIIHFCLGSVFFQLTQSQYMDNKQVNDNRSNTGSKYGISTASTHLTLCDLSNL
jgi:hypothetical protein